MADDLVSGANKIAGFIGGLNKYIGDDPTERGKSTNMNWTPSPNAQQKEQIAHQYDHPTTQRTSQRAATRRAGAAKEYGIKR